MKIAVMGAGAIGGYVGARLAQAGQDVTLIARGAHLAAIKQQGLSVDSPLGAVEGMAIPATDRPEDVGPVDLVLFAVKLWDTDQAATSLEPLLGPDSKVVTLQNGIDSVAAISRHVPAGQVIGGVIYLFAVIERPGVILNAGGVHSMIVGAHGGDPDIAQLAITLKDVPGLDVALSPDIRRITWEKFIRLVAVSGSTALTRKPIGDVLRHDVTRAFFRSLLAEAVAVARAEGQDFSDAHVEEGMAFADNLPPGFKASMLQGLERGHRLELPWLSARVCALAERHGVAAPANQAATWGLTLHQDGQRA